MKESSLAQVTHAKRILKLRLTISEVEALHKLLRLAERDRCSVTEAAARVIAANRVFAELAEA